MGDCPHLVEKLTCLGTLSQRSFCGLQLCCHVGFWTISLLLCFFTFTLVFYFSHFQCLPNLMVSFAHLRSLRDSPAFSKWGNWENMTVNQYSVSGQKFLILFLPIPYYLHPPPDPTWRMGESSIWTTNGVWNLTFEKAGHENRLFCLWTVSGVYSNRIFFALLVEVGFTSLQELKWADFISCTIMCWLLP